MRYLQKQKITLRLWTKKKTFIAIFIALGIIVGCNFSFYLSNLILLPFFLIVITLCSYIAIRKKPILCAIFAISLTLSFAIELLSKREEKEEICETIGIVYECKNNYFFLKSGLSSYYVYEKNNNRQVGDYLAINAKKEEYKETTYENRFSFKDYLLKRGIKYSLRAYKIQEIFVLPFRYRNIEKEFCSYFETETGYLIDNLLFSYRNNNSDQLKIASSLGLLYLFSLSGIYLSFITRFLEKINRRFFKEKTAKIICLITLLFIFPFYISKLGYYRVLVSRFIDLIYLKDDQRIDQLGKVSCTAIVLYIFSLHSPLTSAYLLGIGITFNNALLNYFFNSFTKRKRKIFSSLSVHLFFLPILINNGLIHIFSYFYSLFIPFLIFPFISLSFLSFLTFPFVHLLNGYASFLSILINFINKIDLTIPFVGGTNAYVFLLYYAFYYAFFYFYQSGFPKFSGLLVKMLIMSMMLRYMPISNMFTNEITFINVGQGDAILLRNKTHSVLLDTGGTTWFDLGIEVDLPFLRKKKIYHLDAIITSHGDYDHIGAFSSINSNFNVKKLITSKYEFPLKIGDMEFINLNTYYSNNDEENYKSLVIYLKYLNKKWLFMGDAPKEIEEKIIKDNPSLKADIIKIGHHGSDTSTSESFIKAINPEVAIISVGAKNNFNHPSSSVINLLNKYHITIRRTDIEGSITYKEFSF